MTYLSRLTKLGLAKEVTPYTYLAPTISVPWNTAKFTDTIVPLRDESVRANDSIVQGLNQGPATSTWDLECNAYADLAGHFFRGIIGPDTVAAGVSTTLTANTAVNATTLSLTASVAANTTLQISDASGANLEWVTITTVTGSGPFIATVSAGGGAGGNSTKFAHTAAGGSVISLSTHVFTQVRTFSSAWPTYSLTTDDGQDQLGWPGQVMSELSVKIDPKGFITLAPKYMGFPSAVQSTFAYAASAVQPIVGWGWTMSNPGASTRGLTLDYTFKRATEAIPSSDGLQAPREIFAGAMEIDGAYKAIYDSANDMALFKAYSQGVTSATVQQPLLSGGMSLQVSMSKSGYTTGEADVSGPYVQLAQAISGIANATDAGTCTVTLKNYQSSAY